MESSQSGAEPYQEGGAPVPSRPSSDAFSSMGRVVLPLSDADDFLSDFNVSVFNSCPNRKFNPPFSHALSHLSECSLRLTLLLRSSFLFRAPLSV